MVEARHLAGVVAITLGCALALAGTNRLTREAIRHNQAEADRAAVARLLPVVPEPPPDLSRNPARWRYCQGLVLGRSDASGYGGPIRVLYAVDAGSEPPRLRGVVLLGHQETPGITDFLRDPAWLASLSGLTARDLEATDAISGATITSRALTGHLARALADPEALHGAPLTQGCDP